MVNIKRMIRFTVLLAVFLAGCYKPGPSSEPWKASGIDEAYAPRLTPTTDTVVIVEDVPVATDAPIPLNGITTPTPNPPILLPTPRLEVQSYTVQRGDTLRRIAQQYQVSVDQISEFNDIQNPDLIEVGQVLLIPPSSFDAVASSFKIIPDSELVYSPSNAAFEIAPFINGHNGYLADYYEEIDDIRLSGAEIIQRVALEYSVNPRLLLSVLEYQSGWVTSQNPSEETLDFPMRYYDSRRQGLYKQLGWAANLMNEGYYRWKENRINIWLLSDGSIVQADPTINPGSAGVINLFQYLVSLDGWKRAISEDGLFATFNQLFGYPFGFSFEPLLPEDLVQPQMQLPFEKGTVWSFTGGPHGGWDSGSAWAGLDFAPPGEAMGCVPSTAWVTAVAPGEIVYSDHGAVIQDLAGDGIWQIGWSILYMHIDTNNRVEVGTFLEAGDRVGHPSCEGGFSTGTHLHIARRYNGIWIAADGKIPFVMDGWKAEGYGVEYNGYLVKGDQVREALNGRSSINAIER